MIFILIVNLFLDFIFAGFLRIAEAAVVALWFLWYNGCVAAARLG